MDDKRERQIANPPQENTKKNNEAHVDDNTIQNESTVNNNSKLSASGDTLDAGDWV